MCSRSRMPVSSMKVATIGALKSVYVRIQVFWDMRLRRWSRDSRRFEGPYRLYLQGTRRFRGLIALELNEKFLSPTAFKLSYAS